MWGRYVPHCPFVVVYLLSCVDRFSLPSWVLLGLRVGESQRGELTFSSLVFFGALFSGVVHARSLVSIGNGQVEEPVFAVSKATSRAGRIVSTT